jgi:hypothetical protein
MIYNYTFEKLMRYRPFIIGWIPIPFRILNLTYRRKYLKKHMIELPPQEAPFEHLVYGLHVQSFVDEMGVRKRHFPVTLKSFYFRYEDWQEWINVKHKSLYDRYGKPEPHYKSISVTSARKLIKLIYLCRRYNKIVLNLRYSIDTEGNPYLNKLLLDFTAHNQALMKLIQVRENIGESYFQGFKTPAALLYKCHHGLGQYLLKGPIGQYFKNGGALKNIIGFIVFFVPTFIAVVVCSVLTVVTLPLAIVNGVLNYAFDRLWGERYATWKLNRVKKRIDSNLLYKRTTQGSKFSRSLAILEQWYKPKKNEQGFAALPSDIKFYTSQFMIENEGVDINIAELSNALKQGGDAVQGFVDRLVSSRMLQPLGLLK